MDNTNKIVDYILGNAGKLKSEKIEALSTVINALGEKNPVAHDPNNIPAEKQYEDLDQNNPIALDRIEGFQIEGRDEIYKTRSMEPQ